MRWGATAAGAAALIASALALAPGWLEDASPDRSPAGEQAATLAAARSLLSLPQPLVVAVLGDSTGDEPGEWVDLWAQELAVDRAVSVRFWDYSEAFAADPVRYGAAGTEIAIWNLSQSGTTPGYATSALDWVDQSPDLVLYSYGHNGPAALITAQLTSLDAAVQRAWGEVPRVLVLQNPSTGVLRERQERTIATLRTRWAPRAGVPVVDVHGAFVANPSGLGPLLADGLHPSAAGQRLWARTVAEGLGPAPPP